MCEKKPNEDSAVARYTAEIRRRFPSARLELMPEGMGGSDVWIRLHVLEEDVLDAVEFVAAVEVDIDEDLGVSILTTTGALEEAA